MARAVARGVDVLALTDHDDTGGLAEAVEPPRTAPSLTLVPGAELSVSWETRHAAHRRPPVDPRNRELEAGLARRSAQVATRARGASPNRFAEAGIAGAYEGAAQVRDERPAHLALALRALPGRARAREGHARRRSSVTCAPGKPGYVEHAWATLARGGGVDSRGGRSGGARASRALRVTATGMRRLLGEFRDAGGDGIEVLVVVAHARRSSAEYAGYARVFGLLASVGLRLSRAGREPARPRRDCPPLPAGVDARCGRRGSAGDARSRGKRTVFFLSDRTGITAEMLGNSLLTQFEEFDFQRVTIPFVDSPERVPEAIRQVNDTAAREASGRSSSARWSTRR